MSSETRQARGVAAALAAAALVALAPHLAHAQGRALPALSGERALIGGSPLVLDEHAAQMRFSLDGELVTGRFGDTVERTPVDDGPRALRFNWDTAFSLSDRLELGARMQLSYTDDSQRTYLGPDFWAAVLRGLLYRGEDGDSLTASVALGQTFTAPTTTLGELEATYGIPLGTRARFDLDGMLWANLPRGIENTYGAGVGLGPLWRPVERLVITLDLAGRYGTLPAPDDAFWDARTALRFGVELGAGHELALSGRHTLVGEHVDEETAVLLTWRFGWMTEKGLVRLDDDGGPSPEPEEQ